MGPGTLAAAFWLAGAGAISFDLPDSSGIRHTDAELRGAKAAVFAFISCDCPISNSYAPELARIHSDYAPRGIRFYAVQSDPRTRPEAARRHAAAFSIPFPVLMDPHQTLARETGATTTLEVALVSARGLVLYRGRVDDRVAGFGQDRTSPRRRDLRTALDEFLGGKPVSLPFTKAFGCAIPFAREPRSAEVTFAREVAPLLYRRCASCHREDGVAPFPLLTYEQAAARAALIAKVTAERFMPPWLPDASVGHFRGERRLSADEISVLRRWAEAGAPEGDARTLPAPPRFAEGWQLGKPDRVVEMRNSFEVPAEGRDRYQCFAMPADLGRDRYVRAIEIRPGNRKVVHHALLFQDVTGTARRRDSGGGYECFGAPGFLPVRGLGGWTPGGLPVRMPPGIPLVLHQGADLVVQIHYHPTGKPESDRTAVALYFTDQPPQRHMTDVFLTSNRIDIPPGDRAYKVTDHFVLPVDVEVLGIVPHAHYVCKEMEGRAVLPDGRRRVLLRIRDWNFDWQEQYHYEQPILLPAGTRVEMEFTYDNSEANPRNPNRPPQRVTWGPGTTDEMAGLHLEVVPRREQDLEELGQALWGKMVRLTGGGGLSRPKP